MSSDSLPVPEEVRYIGFWARVVASFIDTILIAVILAPISVILFGTVDLDDIGRESEPAHFLLSVGIPAMVVLVFWIRLQATPGKMVFRARIVDADTHGAPTPWQMVLRYLGYFVSIATAGIGFLWVAFDARKQGFHDKIASTVVVHDPTMRRP